MCSPRKTNSGHERPNGHDRFRKPSGTKAAFCLPFGGMALHELDPRQRRGLFPVVIRGLPAERDLVVGDRDAPISATPAAGRSRWAVPGLPATCNGTVGSSERRLYGKPLCSRMGFLPLYPVLYPAGPKMGPRGGQRGNSGNGGLSSEAIGGQMVPRKSLAISEILSLARLPIPPRRPPLPANASLAPSRSPGTSP